MSKKRKKIRDNSHYYRKRVKHIQVKTTNHLYCLILK